MWANKIFFFGNIVAETESRRGFAWTFLVKKFCKKFFEKNEKNA